MQKLNSSARPLRPTGTSADFGEEAMDGSAERVVAITPATRHVNIVNGETVKFTFGADSFSWHFQTWPNVNVFDFARIAPPALAASRIKVYVAPNPDYRG